MDGWRVVGSERAQHVVEYTTAVNGITRAAFVRVFIFVVACGRRLYIEQV
jgi:hypothetical protein